MTNGHLLSSSYMNESHMTLKWNMSSLITFSLFWLKIFLVMKQHWCWICLFDYLWNSIRILNSSEEMMAAAYVCTVFVRLHIYNHDQVYDDHKILHANFLWHWEGLSLRTSNLLFLVFKIYRLVSLHVGGHCPLSFIDTANHIIFNCHDSNNMVYDNVSHVGNSMNYIIGL